MIAIFLVIALPPAAAFAQETAATADAALDSRAADVVAAINGEKDPEEIFGPAFLAAVPPAQFEAFTRQITGQFGAAKAVQLVDPTGQNSAQIAIRFERAIAGGTITLDPASPHLIVGLLLSKFDPVDDSADKIEADLMALPGEVTAYFGPLDGSSPMLSIGSDRRLALGSTFKLFALSALAHSVERGEIRWSDVHSLERRSFPSGQMQNWPQGAPVTLHTLASMMISISDNTATDQLMALLPESAIGAELARSGADNDPRNTPWLDTLSLFALKGNGDLASAFEAGSEAEQHALVARIRAQSGGDPEKVEPPRFTSPTAIDTIEWFASPAELRRLLARLAELSDPTAREIMSINPSLPAAEQGNWNYIGFKGGSEPGVINLTWLLQDFDGRWYILTMGWNDPASPVDETAFELLAQRVIALSR
ncbi:serine hydrolase [Parerythrobacter lacustris]|uniref:Serine hydrolase n=1 Tax=Parerythrobacter lacustris TaxID=2969984 RepID=A0ABT1XQL0_9SPHN|nr:serine hydrolase [Parerythrobacter lacustris]MCR2833877.1 serine hydrolase [Parerythrobacter lacustris]